MFKAKIRDRILQKRHEKVRTWKQRGCRELASCVASRVSSTSGTVDEITTKSKLVPDLRATCEPTCCISWALKS